MTDTAARPDALSAPLSEVEATYAQPARAEGRRNTEPTRPPSPIEDALGYTGDRLDRLEHVLGELNAVVMAAGSKLEPILTDGTYADLDQPVDPGSPSPEDRRSTIARRISGNATRVDRLTDATVAIRIRLEAILDAVEV